MFLCFGNTLASTFLVPVSNLIYLATCSPSGKGELMSAASLAECVDHVFHFGHEHTIATSNYAPNRLKRCLK